MLFFLDMPIELYGNIVLALSAIPVGTFWLVQAIYNLILWIDDRPKKMLAPKKFCGGESERDKVATAAGFSLLWALLSWGWVFWHLFLLFVILPLLIASSLRYSRRWQKKMNAAIQKLEGQDDDQHHT